MKTTITLLLLLISSFLFAQNNMLNLDGTDDYVSCGNVTALNNVSQVTIETWVNLTQLKNWGAFFTKENGNSNRIGFYEENYDHSGKTGLMVFICNGANTYGTVADVVWIGQWFHIAMVFDGTQAGNANRLKLYINGVLQTLTFTGTIPATTPNITSPVILGNENTNKSEPFQGNLDDMRIWTTARTQTQIQQSMNNELIGTETGLSMYYTFNQGTAGGNNAGVTTLTDGTSNHYNGTLTSFALNGSTSNWLGRNFTSPTTQATNISASGTYNTQLLNLSWTSGSGSGRAVFMKQGNSGNAAPVDLTVYTPNSVFGSGSQIGSTGWYCVYTGTANTVNVLGLSASTSYQVMVCEYNGGTGTILYNTSTATNNPKTLTTNTTPPPSSEPTVQASDLLAAQTNLNCNLAWQNGNGSRRVVFMYNGSSGTAAPVDNTTYTASSAFGSGTQIGSTGWYCVYNGTENNVQVSVNPASTYRFMVCEYNGTAGAENYYTSSAINNPINFTFASITSFTPTTAATGATVTITGTNFTGATAVSFGGTAASAFTVNSSTSITATVASGTSGSVCVTIPGGTATLTGFTFSMVPPGNALAFDGVDDYVQISNPYNGFTNSITVEFWAKINMADCSITGLLGQSNSGIDNMSTNVWIVEILQSTNTLYFYVNDNGTWRYVSTSGSFPASGWHHWVATSNSTSTNFYLDGTLINSSAGISSGIRNSASSVIHIGKEVRYNSGRFLKGSFDEVRIWNTAKTQSELQSNMYSELVGNESGLVAYYNFNQGVAGGDNSAISTLNDKTSNGRNGTLTNLTKTGTISNFVESYALVVPVPAAATSITGTGFTANWAAPATGTVSSYKLDVSTSSTFGSFVTGYQGLDCGTSLSQAVSGLTAGTTYYYRVAADKTSVTGTGGYFRTPTTVTTSCTNPTSGGTIAADQTICSGTVPAAFTSSTAASGNTGTLEYKWQLSTTSNSSGFSDIASSNTTTWSPGALTATTWYKRLARVNCMSDWTAAATSNVIQITVKPIPADQTVSPATQSICSGASATITIVSSQTNINYYLRNNSDNTVIDGPKAGTGSSVNFNTGALTTDKAFNVLATFPKGALAFTGNAGLKKVSLGTTLWTTNFQGTNKATVEAWVYRTATGSLHTIIGNYEGSYPFLFRIDNDRITLFVNSSPSVGGVTPLAINTWYHVAGTYDGTNLKVYVNGVLDGTVAYSGNFISTANELKIGGGLSNNTEYFPGSISDVRLWNVARTAAEISANYNLELSGNESGLVALYKMGEGVGSTLGNSASGNLYPGTLVNSPAWVAGPTTTASACSLQMTIAPTVTVTPNNTASAASSAPTLCISTALTAITHTTTGATGIGAATGLPAGVTAAFASNTITIIGTPTASGTFNYSIPLTGGCGSVTATGTIAVNINTITLSSAAGTIAQTLCRNTAITNITYSTTRATGATFSGLPAGVSGSWLSNVVTISGTPTVAGSYSYTVTLTGGCGTVTTTGTIAVNINTITLGSAAGTNAQTLCNYTALTNITYATTGATGATFSGLPTGVSGAWTSNVVTISGSPTVAGSYSYTVTLTGGCGTITASGTITVITPSISITSNAAGNVICSGNSVTFTSTVTNGGPGLTYQWKKNGIAVSGATSSTYTTSSLVNNDVVSVDLAVDFSNIVSSSLVLHLDAGQSPSYPGTGSAWTDLSGNGNHASLPSALVSSYSSSIGGGSFQFQHNSSTPITSSAMTNWNLSSTNALSVETWVKETNSGDHQFWFSTPDLYYRLGNNPSGNLFWDMAHYVDRSTSNNISAGTWHHVVYTAGIESGNITTRVYIDGVFATSQNEGVSVLSAFTNYLIGSGQNTGQHQLYAYMGLIRVYNKALSVVEVSQNFNAQRARFTSTYAGAVSSNTITTTVSANNTITLSSAAGTNAQTLCNNTAITNITYATTSATGATFSGLPGGVSGAWSSNVVTISGTPTLAGTYSYTVTLTGGCGNITASGSITVTTTSISITSSDADNSICNGVAVTFSSTVQNGGSSPTYQWYKNGSAISGATLSTYSTSSLNNSDAIYVDYSSSCTIGPPVITSGLIQNLDATNLVSYPGTGSTWSDLTVNGYNATLNNNPVFDAVNKCFVFSGTTDYASFNHSWPSAYTVDLWLYPISAPGGTYSRILSSSGDLFEIAVSPAMKISYYLSSVSWQSEIVTVSANTWVNLTFVKSGTTMTIYKNGSSAFTGPAPTTTGGTSVYLGNRIAGLGEAANVKLKILHNYNRALSSSEVTANYNAQSTGTGIQTPISSNTITTTVNANNTITLSSAAGTIAQTLCNITAITNITYATTGATGATFSGLPTGVSGSWSSNVVTISGTPSAAGSYSYTVTLSGGCGSVTASGSISVKSDPGLSNFAAVTKTYFDGSYVITAPTTSSAGAITYTSSNTAVATISGTTVTIVSAGTSTITATQAATATYCSGTISALLTVNSVQVVTKSGQISATNTNYVSSNGNINGTRGLSAYGEIKVARTPGDGLSTATAGTSALQIKQDYPASADGVYWIDMPTVGPTQIYCIMNSACDGGGWMLAMKATTGTTFNYSANYWTTSNTLNPTDNTRNAGDAKYASMNYFQAKDLMALWPDIPNMGAESGSIDGLSQWSWLQNDFHSSGLRTTLISKFAGSQVAYYTATNGTMTFSGYNAAKFSNQGGFTFYGLNYTTNATAKVHWGFAWNNETDQSSNDVSGGIGMDNSYGNYSAGDRVNCCPINTGINRSARVEVYIR